jgi:nucleotide-binding universal stress UspA family protein
MGVPTCVLVGLDTSAESVAALDWSLALASVLGARVVAVHAVGMLEGAGLRAHPDLVGLVREAQDRVGGKAASLSVDLVEEPGSPVEVVLRVSEREGADLVVVGSRGLGGTARQLGSTSEALVCRSHVPVTVLPHGR